MVGLWTFDEGMFENDVVGYTDDGVRWWATSAPGGVLLPGWTTLKATVHVGTLWNSIWWKRSQATVTDWNTVYTSNIFQYWEVNGISNKRIPPADQFTRP